MLAHMAHVLSRPFGAPTRKPWAQTFMTRELAQGAEIINYRYSCWFREQSNSGLWREYVASRIAYRRQFQARRQEMFDDFSESMNRMVSGQEGSPFSKARFFNLVQDVIGRSLMQ